MLYLGSVQYYEKFLAGLVVVVVSCIRGKVNLAIAATAQGE